MRDAFVLTAGPITTRLGAGERTTIVGYDVEVVESGRAVARITRVS